VHQVNRVAEEDGIDRHLHELRELLRPTLHEPDDGSGHVLQFRRATSIAVSDGSMAMTSAVGFDGYLLSEELGDGPRSGAEIDNALTLVQAGQSHEAAGSPPGRRDAARNARA